MNGKNHRSSPGERPGFFRRLYAKNAPAAVLDPTAPNHWQEKILYLFILLAISAGLFLYIPGAYSSIIREYWYILAASTVGYLCCLFIFLFPGLPFILRSMLVCACIYLIGISIIITMGPFYASREWFFAFAVIASILLGWFGALSSTVIVMATCVLIYYLIRDEFWNPAVADPQLSDHWFMITTHLFFIVISTVILITAFFKRLRESDLATKVSAELLRAERNRLAQEIDDRKTFARALQESEEKYRNILETIEDAYFETDLRGRLTFFNRALVEQLGYGKEKLKGMRYASFMDRQNSRKLYENLPKLLEDRQSRLAVDVNILSKHRGVRTANIILSLIRDKAGRPVGFRGVARDTTERVATENRLQQARKMEALGALAGGVAHDLNNTLSGIVSYPELLLANMDEGDPLRKPLSAIKKSGEKAVAIIQDLLTLARRGVAVKEVTNINRLILEYLQTVEFQSIKSLYPHVTIDTNLDPHLLNTAGSPTHLSKTIMNLVINALESMRDEGTVAITTENLTIEKGDTSPLPLAEGRYVVLMVRDTGRGIPHKDLDKIFEPFFSRKVLGRSGTGLGMTVVWGTVQDHGGHIEVKSSVKEGTTITIFLPATEEQMKEKVAAPVDQYRGWGETILIVDDMESQREIAREALESLGYVTVEAKSGVEAIRYLKSNSVDLVLLDMVMRPGIDGLETYRQIIELHPGQKAIIVSGYSETERVKEALRIGVGAYIKKPYSIEMLGIAVRKELERK